MYEKLIYLFVLNPSSEMAEENEKLLLGLLKKSGNSECGDCGSKCEFIFFLIYIPKYYIYFKIVSIA